jgi:hypothetical protein
MKSLDRHRLRRLIINELESIGEDVLVPGHAKDKTTPPMGSNNHTLCKKCQIPHDVCECGSMYEASCDECGTMMSELQKTQVNEGSCGCSDCGCSDKKSDYPYANKKNDSIDYHDILKDILGMHQGLHANNAQDDTTSHRGGAYMSKSQLYKVAKYAEKLYYMIPENHDLEDWMRTKVSQIADDISEVYHALDHDIYSDK